MAGKELYRVGFLMTVIFLLLPAKPEAQTSTSASSVGRLFVTSDQCFACHNTLITPSGEHVSIGADWQSSMMAHASRDPYWQAAVRRETLDHPDAASEIQDECSACHMPMSRYRASVQGEKGSVFTHLPILPARNRMDILAADAVSCTVCHQIGPQRLGTEASFNAGFVVDTETPLGERPVYGPYQVDQGRTRVMQSAARVVPTEAAHIQESELCASCHTLYTHARGARGEKIGELPEQVPYLEWLHSDYRSQQSCQSCHMPRLEQPMAISAVLGQEREGFSQHVFRGGNFFMPRIFNRHRAELGITALPQDLTLMAEGTKRNLQTNAAHIEIERVERSGNALQILVSLTNFTGHKLPTAYPSRRAWVHLTVRDRDGEVLFESGALRPDGSIVGNDNDRDPRQYEPHYERIGDAGQVQIYESIMEDANGRVTTGLISALRFVKDNRILPRGFDKTSAGEDIAVRGEARGDDDFQESGDRILYAIAMNGAKGPFSIQAELWYQPIAFRWARNLAAYEAPETRRFVAYYEEQSDQSAVVLTRDRMDLD